MMCDKVRTYHLLLEVTNLFLLLVCQDDEEILEDDDEIDEQINGVPEILGVTCNPTIVTVSSFTGLGALGS